MEITHGYGAPDANQAIVLRSSRVSNLLACLGGFGLCGGLVWGFLFKAGPFSGWHMLLLGPFVALGGLILLLVCAALWHSFKASYRPSNWSMVIREREILVNLRDYRNAPLGEPAPILHLPTEEVQSAQVVQERQRSENEREFTTRCHRFIDLSLTGADTSALKEALEAEAQHKGYVGRWGKSTTKFQAQPVRLLDGAKIRLPYSKRLQMALEYIVSFEEPVQRNLDSRSKRLPAA